MTSMHPFASASELRPKTLAQRVEQIKRSPTDLRRLAHASGWKVLVAFASKMQAVDSHNEWRMGQGLWANRKFFWSPKMTACVANALSSVKGFQTLDEQEFQHECDAFDAFRKGEA